MKPIYKKGDQFDPDNFRGLAIGAAMTKLYSLILLGRLTEFIKEKELILFVCFCGVANQLLLLVFVPNFRHTIVYVIFRASSKNKYI